MSDIVYGVHTSKVVFSVEAGPDNNFRPQVIVTIPTAALLVMANGVTKDLSTPAAVKETQERVTSMVELMKRRGEPLK